MRSTVLLKGLIAAIVLSSMALAQSTLSDQHYAVFDAKGKTSTLEDIMRSVESADVVFLGELHDDSVGHALQYEIFRRVVAGHLTKRQIALSLEMFERDVQTVLDEYLSSQITETHFLASSRPWGNYKTDYRPLVELARERRLPVIAANAPRRYVNMVSRNGRSALDGLSKQAKAWLPPLPFGEPSAAYTTKFKATMGNRPEAQVGIDKILASQSLWDASMADAIARFVKKGKDPLVVHLNGSFHTESRMGTVEHLLRYRPKTRVLVITMRYENDFRAFDAAKHTDIGDYVILTDAKQPRSQR